MNPLDRRRGADPSDAPASCRSVERSPAAASKTLAEQLDAAQTGEEFGQVLNSLFDSLAAAREDS
jgi:hypothetical protein